ncbi:MAG: hypothetical protein P1R74_15625, partial [Sedimenticola sp.]|nr:hypothetical protein [Sedimenticola sp.]
MAPDDADEETPNQRLLALLKSLDWPKQFVQDVNRLELELAVRKDADVWAEVMTSLVTLLST